MNKKPLKVFQNGAKVQKKNFLKPKIYKDFEIQNSEISFKVDLTFTEEFLPLKILIPISTYPKGKQQEKISFFLNFFFLVGDYEMEVKNKKQIFSVDNLIEALMSTFQFCETQRFPKN